MLILNEMQKFTIVLKSLKKHKKTFGSRGQATGCRNEERENVLSPAF